MFFFLLTLLEEQ